MSAPMLPLLTSHYGYRWVLLGEKEHLHRLTPSHLPLKDHELVKTMLIHASRHIIINRDGEDRKLVKTMLIHASRHIIINRDGEEVTGMSRLGRGHWATDICYN